MSPELIGILSVGVALAALVVITHRHVRLGIRKVRQDIWPMETGLHALEQRIGTRLDTLEQRMAQLERHMTHLEPRMAQLDKRMDLLEGLLDRPRQALFERAREAGR